MISSKLNNGLQIIYNKTNSKCTTIQLTVKVGSNYENKGNRGISHFIEHMVFEGTKTRKNAKIISNEIESLGGEINAYTDNIRTCFYIKVPNKHFEKAAEILSDIIINPTFNKNFLEKERKVILKEINIYTDESRYYQWILFEKTLFTSHPARYPAFGTIEDVKNISKSQLTSFYNKYYTSKNSILTVVGNQANFNKIISKYFSSMKKGITISTKKYKLSENKKTFAKINRKLSNSYMVLGYKTQNRKHKDSFTLDIVQGILGRGQSGKIFDEIRNKRGLAYEVGVHHESSNDYGFFSIYLSTDKKNINKIIKIILEEFNKLQNISAKDLKEAIGYVEGKYILDNEDTHSIADSLAFWDVISNFKDESQYLKKIRNVTPEDIKKVAENYLNKNYTLIVIEQSK